MVSPKQVSHVHAFLAKTAKKASIYSFANLQISFSDVATLLFLDLNERQFMLEVLHGKYLFDTSGQFSPKISGMKCVQYEDNCVPITVRYFGMEYGTQFEFKYLQNDDEFLFGMRSTVTTVEPNFKLKIQKHLHFL